MTVAELIAFLQQIPAHKEVLCVDQGGLQYEIVDVEYRGPDVALEIE